MKYNIHELRNHFKKRVNCKFLLLARFLPCPVFECTHPDKEDIFDTLIDNDIFNWCNNSCKLDKNIMISISI